MSDQDDLRAQLQGVKATPARIEDEYGKGILDIGRYTQLKTEYETRKARLEQALAHDRPDHAAARARLDSPDYAAARVHYLAALRERYGVLQTHAFTALARDERVGGARRLSLLGQGGVYVPLTFDAPTVLRREDLRGGKDTAETEALLRDLAGQEARALGLEDVLALRGHLAVVGDAGSGKTTLLHVIASALAAEDASAVAPDLAPALPQPRPLPVLLPLRLFEHACGQGDYARSTADLLRFLDDWFAEWCPDVALPPGFLSDHVRAGRAWLLLDALDEVADPRHRQAVRNVIQNLADGFPKTRLVVTARVAGYRGARLDDRFGVVHVRDLDDAQRERMIHAIYGGLDLDDAGRRAADLVGRFRASEALRGLGRTPVMVWTAAVIHALRGQLPESRAALYDGYVDILLRHSFKRSHFDTASVDELSGGLGWPLQERRHYLTYAAFQVHRLLEDQPERRAVRPGSQHAVVGEDELADRVLARYFCDNLALGASEARRRAREFLGLMVAHSGLLYETPQGYTVGDHLTMQEFLAGCYLGDHYQWEDEAGYRAFLGEKTGDPWWREVFILAAGYLAGQPGFAARNFLRQIAAQGATPVQELSALALAARALLQLRDQRQRPNWYDGLARDLANKLHQRLYAAPAPSTGSGLGPAAARQEAGLALGLLCGYPGQGGPEDPCFPHPGSRPDFVRVAGGEFWMGDDKGRENERPRHRVRLEGFEMARFPTTNAMFARFIAAGGYQERRWWEAAIAHGRWAGGRVRDYRGERSQPFYWDDARYNNPAQPVVGVTWYEALAYCAWLTATLDDGHTYGLPSEAQWERAARGRQGRAYPWGDEWAGDHCNSAEAGLETPSPVGLFPQGATPEGIQDMAGNVWEWTSSLYGEYPYRADDGREDVSDTGDRVLRGGAWLSSSGDARSAIRNWNLPDLLFDNFGFRCLIAPTSSLTRF
jgi:formylglycine-generating enzyme required for sulfatase activity